MTPLALTLRRNPCARIDLSPLTPDRLIGQTRDGIARIRLHCGRQRICVGELFDIAGRDPGLLQIRHATAQLFRIGYQMKSGSIEVEGNAGDNVGERMQGGMIRVHGDAGEWAGASMLGGSISVQGSVGHRAGAAPPGQLIGMKDGLILVEGDAGDRLGERMRGGTIVTLGDSGAYLACRMRAGTVVVMGRTGAHIGIGMRRGTLVIGRKPATLPTGFRSAGALKMEFLRLLFKQLGNVQSRLAFFRNFGPEAVRLAGDLSVGGKGEILLLLNAIQGQTR